MNVKMPKKKSQQEPIKFEEAFTRLEDILERMNSGTVSLDNALQLYEEADGLIVSCQKQLNTAEQKIEMLIKNRQGELSANDDQQPLSEVFSAHTEA